MVLDINVFGSMLALSVFCQRDASLIVTVGSYAGDELGYYLEFVKEMP